MKGFQKILRLCASSTLIAVLVFCTGCTAIPFYSQTAKTELSMQVESTRDPGIYQVTGRSNLPNQTRLTIQAIRNLQPNSQSGQSYSILAQTEVKVEQGKWQTSLNLLQQDKLEAWQKTAKALNLKSEPEKQVRFLAVTEPTENSIGIQSQSTATGNQGTSIQFTADGRSYLQAEQVLSIELPRGNIIASEKPAQTVVKVAVQSINQTKETKSQTDAELPTQAWMR